MLPKSISTKGSPEKQFKSISTKGSPEKQFKENSYYKIFFCKRSNSTKVNFNRKAFQKNNYARINQIGISRNRSQP